ncbi:MAG: peptidoglycan-associated lipoprotein Pal [bacterium]|uniref:Peptidoglycan-associated lipoprotein n=1 Tax=Candidatus Methylomirabilis tolerans TaxID=3123416 RepID=A0AAJ1AIJ7_9BACT|nr:peptidoglycan-associated lipoprotein Pal [Candidatus Methylomirabilis sp.]
MDRNLKTGRVFQLALICASVALIITGCATTASYRPDIDGMKATLAEVKTAGAEMRAPEEFAAAETCLDWFIHEATEFNPFADPDARIRSKCQAAFAALKAKMAAAAPAARIPAEAVLPPVMPQSETAQAGGAEKASPLKDIFFDYDRGSIRTDMKKSLNENIRWLTRNPTASIIIEGHCDERGTQEYNLALSQKRAKSVANYLAAAGIDTKRIKIISYGKERPFAPGHDESAWKWNRRAHFVLQ